MLRRWSQAGVFMVTRLAPLYNLSPVAMAVVAITGGVTIVVGATIALTQTDIKRVVAYSTVSQLRYMIMACGLGAYAAGRARLLTHSTSKPSCFSVAGPSSSPCITSRICGAWAG